MNVIDSLMVEAEREVTRRNYEVVSAVLHDTEWDRVCAFAAVYSKYQKVAKTLAKTEKSLAPNPPNGGHALAEWCDLDERRNDLTKQRNELSLRLARLERCGRCNVCSPTLSRLWVRAQVDAALAKGRAGLVLNPVSFEPQFPDDYDDGFIAEGGEGD